jgi:hypothetical protein
MFTGKIIPEVLKFSTVGPDTCGSALWNLLHVTLLAPGIFRWILGFCKIYASFSKHTYVSSRHDNKAVTVLKRLMFLYCYSPTVPGLIAGAGIRLLNQFL